MRTLGIFLVAAGIVWALIAFNMDTTVTTGSQSYGSGDSAIDVPSVTVNNLGLMETRRNNLMFSGLTILIGVVLIGFGSLPKKSAATGAALKACPFCAELIQPTAPKCRYCSSDLPNSFTASAGAVSGTSAVPGSNTRTPTLTVVVLVVIFVALTIMMQLWLK